MLNKNNNEKDKDKILEYNKNFSENMKSIINLYYLLEKISKNGYHDKLKIKIAIEKNKIFYKINNFFLIVNYL